MTEVIVGNDIPNYSFSSTQPHLDSFSQLKGKFIVLYFYPKDQTPGCTLESQTFRDYYPEFQAMNTEIIGISRDNLKSHERFICKESLPFPLISDQDEALCTFFDVIKLKNMYGKQVRGIERSTFLFDPEGKLQKIWRKVKVEGHVEDILLTLKKMINAQKS